MMGIVAGLGAAAAAASLASSVSSMTSGPSGGTGSYGGNPNTYIPGAQPQADNYYRDIFNQMAPYAASVPGQTIPGYQTYTSNIQNTPYAGLAQSGADRASDMGPAVSQVQYGGAANLANLAAGAVPYGGEILAAGFDPQNALYNRSVQQLQDQINASNAASGVSGPAAAGVADQALTNFNIDWQNQQLARESQAAQGYGNLTSDIGRLYSGAGDLGNAAIQTRATAAGLPYSTYVGQQGTDINALNSLASGYNTAFGPQESLANLLQSYMGLGQSATGLAQAGQAQAFNQNQILGSNIGQSLSGLAPALGSLFSGGSANGSLSGTNFWGSPTAMYTPDMSYATAAAPGMDQVIPM